MTFPDNYNALAGSMDRNAAGGTVELRGETLQEMLRKALNLKRVSIVHGGPSASDPMGEVETYLGLIDEAGNGYWIGVSEDGRIVKCGSTVSGRRYELPATERVNG